MIGYLYTDCTRDGGYLIIHTQTVPEMAPCYCVVLPN